MRLARALLKVATLIALLATALPASAQQQNAVITAPSNGAQLTGVVQIMGTAAHGKFERYELAYSPQNADSWQLIASVQNQINNGSLGTWDTATLQPGVYRLRLRLFRDNNDPIDFVVNNLNIKQGTPTPAATLTPQPGPTIPPSPTRGAGGPTPTVMIVQPPTSTPQSAATPKPGASSASATSGGTRGPSIHVNFASFGQSFCNGALYTGLLFAIWGVVLGLREIGRWVLRLLRTAYSKRQT